MFHRSPLPTLMPYPEGRTLSTRSLPEANMRCGPLHTTSFFQWFPITT